MTDWKENLLAVGPGWVEKIEGGWRMVIAPHGNKVATHEEPHFVMETKDDLWVDEIGGFPGGEDK
jgi:hypothetical protein